MRSVIEMAREAGLIVDANQSGFDSVEHFAELVRADEREVCAKDADWCIQNHLEHLIPERIRARGNK